MQCKYCGQYGFKNIKGLSVHRRYNSKCLEAWKKEQEQIRASKSYVKCEICGELIRNISNTHLRKHNITQQEYKTKYPNAPIFASGLLDVQRDRRESKIIERYGNQDIKSPTLENFQRKYGIEEGKVHFNNWKDVVGSKLNSYQNKYGYEDGLIKYQIKCEKSSTSLNNFIRRFGEELGTQKYQDFCESCQGRNTLEHNINLYGENKGRQKYKLECENKSKGHLIDYYFEKYGVEEGQRIWNEINDKKILTLENFISKYGIEEGTNKYHALYKDKEGFSQSDIALDLFDKIVLHIPNEKVYYYNTPKEYGVYLHEIKKYTFLDFFVKSKGKVIEFNGNYWHGNPDLYPAGTLIQYPNKHEELVEVIQERDRLRNQAIEKALGVQVLVIWEKDYKEQPDEVFKKCLRFINDENI